ncbi:Nramp family divalent metal transporter [Streptomyces natalensis]|uniref:Manganese transporter n=1 Tax=Streptomyces natalensis ATCC 27448 TaxID=1240678 RepID=A0A0D7CTT8_9ACTN|nr:Nramp family divalent metal transporter [Streptomyces natalensis]KIZ19250.1 manganese transporter [Streptomyces natalensis ATCC 27448]
MSPLAPGRAPAPARPRPLTVVRLMGPAFVAAIAYVDPGNVATNITAGARYGYLLVWVVVGAGAMAMLVQYLSAKLTLATGRTLPELCAERFRRGTRLALWVQAEIVAVATDLAEVVGGAVALQLLFGIPLLTGGLLTGLVSWLVIVVQSRRGQRPFEAVVGGLLAVVLTGFLYDAVSGGFSARQIAAGMVPRFAGPDSLLLACGIVGATVMPHAIYLHGALVRDRHGAAGGRQRTLLGATRVDVLAAMSTAAVVNLAMLVVGAATLGSAAGDSIEAAHRGLAAALGPLPAMLFAVALLASGFAATSVGTYAGAVILEGFVGRTVPLAVRRLLTLVPALAVLALGAEPGRALVLSQVVLSFGIPFALWPLVAFTAQRQLMGRLVNGRLTTVCAVAAASVSTLLNAALLWLTLAA